MSDDITFTHGALRLAMDFFEIDERSESVHARILIEYMGRRQKVSWILDGVWIEYAALSEFEKQLSDGREAALVDMSQYVVLHFHREHLNEHLLVNPPAERSSADGALIDLKLVLEYGAMDSFSTALKDFPKWW